MGLGLELQTELPPLVGEGPLSLQAILNLLSLAPSILLEGVPVFYQQISKRGQAIDVALKVCNAYQTNCTEEGALVHHIELTLIEIALEAVHGEILRRSAICTKTAEWVVLPLPSCS